jgi:hypothetical protein
LPSHASDMLSARLQAIGGARTFTSQDSQPCRLLTNDADVSMVPPKIPYGGFSPVRLQGRSIRRAFLPTTSASLWTVCIRPSCTPLPITLRPRSKSRNAVRWCTTVRAAWLLYPRGPRSGPGYAVPVHPHLTGPIRPTHRHSTTSPHCGLYALPSLCAQTAAPRRPTSGSVLSLASLLDMSSSGTAGSSTVAYTQFLHR